MCDLNKQSLYFSLLALHSFEGIGAIWLRYTKNAWATGGWNSAGGESERGGLQ